MRPRFNIRDLLWAILVVAVCLGWYVNDARLKEEKRMAVDALRSNITALNIAVEDAAFGRSIDYNNEIQERFNKYKNLDLSDAKVLNDFKHRNFRDKLMVDNDNQK
jgi:hypothetical protein